MSETLFKHVTYDLQTLISFIDMGQIGLPDIQRPFVWPNAKVRDLFDSMYRGYPIGNLLFWQNAVSSANRQIGVDRKQKVPDLLIVDGQQRLTSLYAVFRGIPVLRQNYQHETITIAFDPLHEQLEVFDAAIRRDKSYIPNISALWAEDPFEVTERFVEGLSQAREVTPDEIKHARRSIMTLYNLQKFPFSAVELSKDLGDEQVAEIFVRINSKGQPLNQSDFILTLMSVYWDAGRKQLEEFCRSALVPTTGQASPFNHFIEPAPDQLLRASVALAFRRARLQHVYSLLRGKDLETGEFSDERRESQFGVLRRAQDKVLDLNAWHDFFHAIRSAGFVGGRLITSQTTLMYSYALYLIGKHDYSVPQKDLRRSIARWFFMSTLTARYTSSSESAFEFDLAGLRNVGSAEEFVAFIDAACEAALPNDYWTVTLPNDLATSSPRSPSLFAFYAAQVLEGATALFSDQKVEALLEPSVHSKRSAVERHHLFPKAYLNSIGITDQRDTNQIANYTLVEWGDNTKIGGQSPAEYLPEMVRRVKPDVLVRQYQWHALPDGWENMQYPEFLARRRELMAQFIAETYRKHFVATEVRPTVVGIETLIRRGEGYEVEFKSTLRVNMHTGEKDARMEHACLKTIAGFLNGRGGTLIIGVADDGETVGVARDDFPNEDKMALHLVALVRDRLGSNAMMYVHPRFDDRDASRIMVVECWAAQSPIYLKDGQKEQFFVRTGPSTTELQPSQIQAYLKQRFR